MSELLGADLDAAVARALDVKGLVYRPNGQPAYKHSYDPGAFHDEAPYDRGYNEMFIYFKPSVDGRHAMALQIEHHIACYPLDPPDDRDGCDWAAGFDLRWTDDGIELDHCAQGATPQIAICRAIVHRDKDQKVAQAQAAVREASEAHLEALKSQAWERATEARRSRVPFTAFANDEEREAYRWAMDSQLDVIKNQNPEQYPPKVVRVRKDGGV